VPQLDQPNWWPRDNAFRRRLRDGAAPPVTIWVTLGSVNVVELIGAHRPDAVILDMEHTTSTLGEVQAMILAAQSAQVTALVRVPHATSDEVGRLLDAGADGIVFPVVSSEAQAQAAARSVAYPPHGSRGWAGTHARRSRWAGQHVCEHDGVAAGVLSPTFVKAADEAVTRIFMIEDPAGVAAIDAILDAGAPDAVIFGWGDFTVQVGFDAQAVAQAQTKVFAACRGRGIGVALGTSPRDAELYYPGCFLSAGVESTLFSDAVATELQRCGEFGRTVAASAAVTQTHSGQTPDSADDRP
jgi:4-hydroxy-2-oxoheptanedioate aldolase